MNREFGFWVRWLGIVGWVLIVFGLGLAVFNQSAFFDVGFNQRIDPVFWPEGGPPENTQPFQAWIYGVLGATVAGWGVFILFLARFPLRDGQRWAWTCILVGFTLWFLVDTAISAYFGVFFNVFFNVFLALLVYLPLAATRRGLK
jgi:hypothetical protein